MRNALGWLHERWFEGGLRFFAAGVAAAMVAIAVARVPQMHFLAWLAFAQALAGLVLCAMGLRATQPARWHALISRFRQGHAPRPIGRYRAAV